MEVIPTFSTVLSDWEPEPLDVESKRWTETLVGDPMERRALHLPTFCTYDLKMPADAII